MSVGTLENWGVHPKAGPDQDTKVKVRAEARFISADLCSPKDHGTFDYYFPTNVLVFKFYFLGH